MKHHVLTVEGNTVELKTLNTPEQLKLWIPKLQRKYEGRYYLYSVEEKELVYSYQWVDGTELCPGYWRHNCYTNFVRVCEQGRL